MNDMEFEARGLSEDYGLAAAYEAAGLAPERPIEVIEGEILFYKQVAGGAVLEIGRRLIEAKEQLKHGEWESWLEEKVGFSVRSAQRYMRLAKGYGESDTVALLGTRKALVLLGLEDSERSEFLEENDAENMTAAELEEAIRQRNEARLEREQALADKQVAEAGKAKLEAEMVIANSRIEAADKEAEKLRKQIRELEAAGKQNKLGGNAELVQFNAHFRIAQEQVEEMAAIVRSLRSGGDTGLAEKLCRALDALVEMIREQKGEADG